MEQVYQSRMCREIFTALTTKNILQAVILMVERQKIEKGQRPIITQNTKLKWRGCYLILEIIVNNCLEIQDWINALEKPETILLLH
jgi:hypothetical protein